MANNTVHVYPFNQCERRSREINTRISQSPHSNYNIHPVPPSTYTTAPTFDRRPRNKRFTFSWQPQLPPAIRFIDYILSLFSCFSPKPPDTVSLFSTVSVPPRKISGNLFFLFIYDSAAGNFHINSQLARGDRLKDDIPLVRVLQLLLLLLLVADSWGFHLRFPP